MSSTTPTLPYHTTSLILPWKPWSIPLSLCQMQRKLCGLLNRITTTNFSRISDAIVDWAIRVESTDDMAMLSDLASLIMTRGLSDTTRAELYGELCQKIMNEVQGEQARWRRVNPGGTADPFGSAMRAVARRELGRVLEKGDIEGLSAMSQLITELLLHDVLLPGDVEDLYDVLFTEAVNENEEYGVILYRSFSRLLCAPEVLGTFIVTGNIEYLLEHGKISPKVRYLMMALLDRANDPQPQDAFTTSQPRAEIYGIASQDSVDDPACGIDARDLRVKCDSWAQSFLSSKQLTLAEDVFGTLRAGDRHLFVASLVTLAVSSNDEASAISVGSLFALETIQELCRPGNSLAQGFHDPVSLLEDTVLDIPNAYRLVALMMHEGGLDVMEDLARYGGGRESLLSEILSFDSGAVHMHA